MLKTFLIALLLICCLGCSITLKIQPLLPQEPLEPPKDVEVQGQDVHD